MPQRLNSYFHASHELHQLSHQVAQLVALQRHYEHFAPAPLVLASHVVQLAQQTLVIAANNSAVAAKLRQLSPRLTQYFQDNGHEITGIQVKVQVSSSPPARRSSPLTLSLVAQQKLVMLAENLSDSPLKKAIQRLARRAK
ncbi:MAG: DciA family protein [Gallionellaceae bacterium]|nr:DciA family protein [Gallionellaceae bacterium]